MLTSYRSKLCSSFLTDPIANAVRRAQSSQNWSKIRANESIQLWSKILPYMWPSSPQDRAQMILSTGLMLAGKYATIKSPKLMAEVIEELGKLTSQNDNKLPLPKAMPAATRNALYRNATRAYIYKLLSLACGESRHALFAPVIQKSGVDLASKTFKAVHELPLLELQEMQLGKIASIQSRGIKSIANLMSAVFFRGFPCIVEFSLVLKVLMQTIGRQAAIISTGTVWLFTKYTFNMSAMRVRQRRRMNQLENAVQSEFIDSLTNAEPIRLFGVENIRSKKFVDLAEKFEHAQKAVSRSLASLNFGQGFIFNVGIYSCQMMAMRHILSGNASVSDLILATNLLQQLAIPLNFTGVIYREAKNSMQDLQALYDLTQNKLFGETGMPAIEGASAKPEAHEELFKPLLAAPQKITFENVSYAYKTRGGGSQKGPMVLDGLSLEIDPTDFVAIVGRSGSGKSTLIKLLYRLMKPDSGRILLGSTDIQEIPIDEWRRYLGIVPQDIPLFNDTIRNNVTMGDTTISEKRIQEAVKSARLGTLLEKLPKGLETTTGERGMALSGGERQRLALSRCLSRDPKVVIFDEATSSLDVQTEREIMNCATSQRMSDVTRLVVAHRLSSIKNADRIVVMGGGRVLEFGDHRSLLKNEEGTYSGLWREQIRGIH